MTYDFWTIRGRAGKTRLETQWDGSISTDKEEFRQLKQVLIFNIIIALKLKSVFKCQLGISDYFYNSFIHWKNLFWEIIKYEYN